MLSSNFHKVKLDNAILRPQNTLLLHFKPAKHIAKMLESKYGRVRAGSCHVGDPSRVYVRKAQYDWRYAYRFLYEFRILIVASIAGTGYII